MAESVRLRCERGHEWYAVSRSTGPGFSEWSIPECPWGGCGLRGYSADEADDLNVHLPEREEPAEITRLRDFSRRLEAFDKGDDVVISLICETSRGMIEGLLAVWSRVEELERRA